MARRHELTDDEWAVVEPPLPARSRGRAWAGHRRTINGVLFWASAGIQWRDRPDRFGPWQAVYERFRRWRDDGTWATPLRGLLGSADRAGLVDWSPFCIDSATVRARRSAAGGGKSRAGGGASRPRLGPRPGRVLDQTAPRHRRQRVAAGRAGDGRAGA